MDCSLKSLIESLPLLYTLSRWFRSLELRPRKRNQLSLTRLPGLEPNDLKIIKLQSNRNDNPQQPKRAGSRLNEGRIILLRYFPYRSCMINKLNSIYQIANGLSAYSSPMAAGTNRPHHIHLHHNHIRLILQLILDAPPPQLIIAHPSSHLHQSNLLPGVAGIIDLLFNGDLLKERGISASDLTDLLHLLLHQQAMAGVLVQVKAITSGHMVRIHRHQSLRRISEHMSPRVTNTRTSN
jgi:hypothetical protein